MAVSSFLLLLLGVAVVIVLSISRTELRTPLGVSVVTDDGRVARIIDVDSLVGHGWMLAEPAAELRGKSPR